MGDERRPEKMGRQDARQKKGETRRKRKTNGEIRCETEKKWGDETRDKKMGSRDAGQKNGGMRCKM